MVMIISIITLIIGGSMIIFGMISTTLSDNCGPLQIKMMVIGLVILIISILNITLYRIIHDPLSVFVVDKFVRNNEYYIVYLENDYEKNTMIINKDQYDEIIINEINEIKGE